MVKVCLHVGVKRPVRWLISGLVWAGWCWFVVREKHCRLASLGWLKPTSEQAAESKQTLIYIPSSRLDSHCEDVLNEENQIVNQIYVYYN